MRTAALSSTFDREEWWESSLCWKHCEAGRLEGHPVTFRPRRNHQQHHNTGAHSMEWCVHTVGTSGANISLSVTAPDLEQLQAVTPTVFYCCARRRRRFRLCFLTGAAAPSELLPTPGWLDIYGVQCRWFETKQNKRSVCVGSVEDKGQFLRVKTHRVAAAASSCLQGRVQWFQAGNAGWLRLCWPRPSAALVTLYFDKKVNRLEFNRAAFKNLQAAEKWLWSVLVWMFGRCPLPQKVFWITTGGAFRFKLLLKITAPLLFTQATKYDPVRCQFHSARSLKPFKLENMMMTTINKLHKNHWSKCGKAVSFPINTTVVVLLPGDTASWKWCSLSSSGKLALHVPGQEDTGVEGYYQSWLFDGQCGGMKN